ncbi:MAG: hypothetical protein ACR2GR_12640 [Rhodothermales bacterium]
MPYEAAYGDHFEDVQIRVPDTAKLEARTGISMERGLEDMLRRILAAHPRVASETAYRGSGIEKQL